MEQAACTAGEFEVRHSAGFLMPDVMAIAVTPVKSNFRSKHAFEIVWKLVNDGEYLLGLQGVTICVATVQNYGGHFTLKPLLIFLNLNQSFN